jgi:hypothetical protein
MEQLKEAKQDVSHFNETLPLKLFKSPLSRPLREGEEGEEMIEEEEKGKGG